MSSPATADKKNKLSVEKPRFNVYTMMLIISFIAVCIGCILLYLEITPYSEGDRWPWEVPREVMTAPQTQAAGHLPEMIPAARRV